MATRLLEVRTTLGDLAALATVFGAAYFWLLAG